MTNTQIKNRKYFSKSRSNDSLRNKNKKKPIFSLALFNRFLSVLLFFSVIFYVLVINDIAVKGIVLEELKKQEKKLNVEAKNHELAIMHLESFDNISRKAADLKMVKVDEIEYIVINNNGVAMK